MTTWGIILICVLGVLIVAAVVLFILGRRMQKKQDVQQEEMKKQAQPMSFYIIDKKKMRLKDAGLPKVVYDNAGRLSKISKLPILKVKVGNRVMSLACDNEVYKTLLPKQEVKAQVSGIYVISAKRVRGPMLETKAKRGKDGKKKESFIDRLR